MVVKTFSTTVSPASEGEGETRRSILSPASLMTVPGKDVNTLCDILEHSAKHYPSRRAFGYRTLENTFTEEKQVTKVVDGAEVKQTKTWTFFQLSDYRYYTYAEGLEMAHQLGAGLRKLGLGKGNKVQCFASTSVEWMLFAHGAFTQAMTIVTAYDTLGAEGLKHSLNEAESSLCFINGDQLTILETILPDCPNLHHIVYRGEPAAGEVDRLRALDQVKTVISFEALCKLGKESPVEVVKPASSDMCCIMYTSGSTGNPKGVILTHGNVVAAIAGVCRMLQHLVEKNDTMMAYLPLAHVLEFLVENLCIFLGLTLGYGTIRTLTDVSVRNCKGDIQAFAPTIMTGVPQVWETIRKTVLAKVKERGPRVASIFHSAVDWKEYLAGRGLPTGFLDRLIFKTVKQQLGGKIRYGLSGGAPLSSETQRFLSLTVAPILGGYGMTESCGMCTIMAPEQFAYGQVGAPVPCVEVKLVDVPDAGYRSTNTPKPQGEIWIRGPSITPGYFKQDAITRETLTEDGWLRTGDIGEWNETGTLSIIDRKKNLVKMSNGEYIALEKLESVYKSSVLVENMCVYADSLYPKPVALVVPVEAQLCQLAKDHGIVEPDWETLCEREDVRKLALKVLLAQATSSGLQGAELIHNVWLCKDLWTTEEGLLTAAQKLKRKDITEKYSAHLEQMTRSQQT